MSGKPEQAHSDNYAYNEALQKIRDAAARSTTQIRLSLWRRTSLPHWVARLKKLRKLDLGGNQFTSLPPEIGQLENLVRVDVADNPLRDPPLDVVRQGTRAILQYLKAKAKKS